MKAAQNIYSSTIGLPVRSFIYSVVLNSQIPSISSISSDDSLRCCDPETLEIVTSFSQVHHGVTCLTLRDSAPNDVITAGRDGAVRFWDVRKKEKIAEITDLNHAPIISLASTNAADAPLIAIGTELTDSSAAVAVWDIRYTTAPIRYYSESHSDDITKLVFHPSAPSQLVSGSTDGLINIYDTSKTDEDDAVIQAMNHGSINHITFLSDEILAAVSHDETFGVYDVSNDASEGRVIGDLRARLDCQYIIDVLSTGFNDFIVSGSTTTQSAALVPFKHTPDCAFDIEASITLPGAHEEEIVRSIAHNPSAHVTYTAGEDGYIKAWRLPDMDECLHGPEPVSSPSHPKRHIKDNHHRSGVVRYKPY